LAKGIREDGGWSSLPRALSAKLAVANKSHRGAFRSLYG
jgi:hypothetical protein